MIEPRAARLHALVYGTGALLLLGHALWLYLMGDYPSILLPVLLTPLMLLAALLRLGQDDHARLSAYLVLICGYLLIAVELPQQASLAPLWLGLPAVLTLLLLPLGPAMLLNVMLVPVWLILVGGEHLDRDLTLSYLALIVVAGLTPWEFLRQQALLRATDPRDPECSAINRETLHDRLSSECERAELLDQRLVVLLLHLPQLDMAGEQFGPRARQALLDAVCIEVDKRCRDHDLLGREGQADFWLVLPDTSENGAMLVCQRLEQSLQRTVLLETGPIETRLALCLLQPRETPEHFEQRLQARTQRLADI
ncbi:GGDEF domain-containing protein [Halomonas sp. EGI 63088]|uniref:GGDEF domain-containing protein n=1 Tax=Halomonas flagellata TaxID=2920385 RepID=A0ABS9RVA0_9GAMM|nr:GGDEF domain-containing protein [Halomonas flagellata]MCH4563781.1 GGDEF domain-containing protein [Halomonas flagellata]